jgi:hypothetical protein
MSGSTVLESGTFTLTRLVASQVYGCGEVEGAALPTQLLRWPGARTASSSRSARS